MRLSKTKTDVVLDETIHKLVVHANFLRLYVEEKEILADIPFEQIQSIMVFGSKINIPGRLIKECNIRQIPFHLLTDYYKHNGSIYFSTHDNIKNRIEQFKTLTDPKWRLFLSKQIINQKLLTQKIALKYFNCGDIELGKIQKYIDKIPNYKTSQSIFGAEGVSATIYWSNFGLQIPRNFAWKGRIKNPCLDPVNSLLSFAYALLATQCQTSLTLNGLDSYYGILHTTSEKRPALVYDLMEIYRVFIVDFWVLSLFQSGTFKPEDFTFTQNGVCTLKIDKKNEFFRLWYKRLKYYKFTIIGGKTKQITIHDFFQANTGQLINWFKEINTGKVRDTGNFNRLSKNLIIFKNLEEFKKI